MAMTFLPLSTITVTHNHANYIGRCRDALVSEVSRIGGEVIVVDNRSEDESAAILALNA
jgi:glycosyltransferase involved in cell wall biosynthesis